MLTVSGPAVFSTPAETRAPIRLSVQAVLSHSPKATLLDPPSPYPAHETQPIEPILIPKLRIRLAEFPYATLFYAPETAHLGDLMRIRYGLIEAQRISPSHWLF